jgi:hypothetical protein
LEEFEMGFDRNDRATWVPEKMPHHYKGGLFVNYGSGHEQFIWDIKWVKVWLKPKIPRRERR